MAPSGAPGTAVGGRGRSRAPSSHRPPPDPPWTRREPTRSQTGSSASRRGCRDAVGRGGITVNQFLVLADEPLLFHTGLRSHAPATLAAVSRFVPLDELRWVSFGHVEADECGALDLVLDACPRAEVTFGALGCALSLDDVLGERRPRALAPGEALDLGGRRIVAVPTPHAPAQPGGPGALRGDHRHAAVRRPVHPAGRRAGARRPVARGGGARRPRTCCAAPRRARRCPTRSTTWPATPPARWPRCTARRSTATARRRCARWPRAGGPGRRRASAQDRAPALALAGWLAD